MTTGEQLVSLSGMLSGTAMAHLLAITAGTGEAVYSNFVRVVTSQPEVFVQRKAKRGSAGQEKRISPTHVPENKDRRVGVAYVQSPTTRIHGFTQAEEVFVLVRNAQSIVVQSSANAVIAQRKNN